jgi:hypothetical protein
VPLARDHKARVCRSARGGKGTAGNPGNDEGGTMSADHADGPSGRRPAHDNRNMQHVRAAGLWLIAKSLTGIIAVVVACAVLERLGVYAYTKLHH